MLQQGSEGFTVDFEPIEKKKSPLTPDEVLLLKLRGALERTGETGPHHVDLEAAEGRRLGAALERLEGLQTWPPDVLTMSQGIRERLSAVE